MPKKRIISVAFLVLIFTVIGIARQTASAQVTDSLYFPETGHWVTGDFLTKYQAIPNPTTLYGNPLTEAFIDSEEKTVQYLKG